MTQPIDHLQEAEAALAAAKERDQNDASHMAGVAPALVAIGHYLAALLERDQLEPSSFAAQVDLDAFDEDLDDTVSRPVFRPVTPYSGASHAGDAVDLALPADGPDTLTRLVNDAFRPGGAA